MSELVWENRVENGIQKAIFGVACVGQQQRVSPPFAAQTKRTLFSSIPSAISCFSLAMRGFRLFFVGVFRLFRRRLFVCHTCLGSFFTFSSTVCVSFFPSTVELIHKVPSSLAALSF